jgi:hypothetical protein
VTDRTPETTLFELALYLVACARLAVDENSGLASFRLIEGGPPDGCTPPMRPISCERLILAALW